MMDGIIRDFDQAKGQPDRLLWWLMEQGADIRIRKRGALTQIPIS